MDLHPLTKPQQAIWNMEQYFGGSVGNITASMFFNEPVDIIALQAALNNTMEQCDSLRIRLKTRGAASTQYIKPFKPSEFEIVRFATKCDFDSWVEGVAKTPFDLSGDLKKIFIAVIGRKTGFVLHLHHIAADAWTYGVLIKTVAKNLRGETVNTNSYLECLAAQQDYETSAQREKDKAFFLSCFERCSEPVYLSDMQAKNTESNRLSFVINAEETARIKTFCDDNRMSPYSLFMSALATYLYRIKGMQDIYIGTTVLNRSGKRQKETAGTFINTVPVLLHIDETKSTLENLRGNTKRILNVFRHHKYHYIDLLKDIRKEYGFTDRLYDVMLNYQNVALEDDNMTAEWHFCGCQGESLCIHINDHQNEEVFNLNYDYQAELLSRQDVEHLHGHLMNLLFDCVDDSGKKPQELKMLTNDERQKVVYGFNDTAVDYPEEKCIHQLFEDQAAKTPDAVAVVFEGEDHTYKQINETANSLAHLLREKGVGRNDIVAIIAKRSYKIIVAQFAILKAGGAYLPIDPNYPEERINYMLSDAKCKTALTYDVCFDGIDTVYIDGELSKQSENLSSINAADDLCYLIYTSGSTGLPKGTMLSHNNVANYCNNNNNNVIHRIIKSNMRSIVSITTMGFDIFVTESLLPLINGLTIIFANEHQSNMQDELNKLVLRSNADVMQTTPSKMQLLMMDRAQCEYLGLIKTFILGGEALDPAVVERLRLFTSASIYNIYGPTETTVWSSNAAVEKTDDISIGRPIANTQIYILDKHLNPLPIGAAGELCIAGAGVGKGYLNRPELTAEKFVDNPFGCGRMYKTGDLARWRKDGSIDYIGRMDNQVKIRGLRIELGEIETAISKFGGVKQNAVVVMTDENSRQYICAYYVGEDVDTKEIKTALAKVLPQYMIPHYFIEVDVFPTTPSGKTDRKAFPPPDFSQSHSDAEYAAPETGQEKLLVSILEAVLGVSPVGMNDNFFDLGADSLKAIEFIAKAQNEGFTFSIQDVFDYPNAALLMSHATVGKEIIKYDLEHFAEIHELLESSRIKEERIPGKRSLGDVLVTGATGWLGAHVLDAFLSAEQGKAWCLVRGADLTDSKNRLSSALEYYFGDKYVDFNRIITICGDITETIETSASFGTIIHCAANVRHYGDYQHSHRANVDGTKNMIALAKEKSSRLIHISTASVSGNSFEQPPGFPRTVFDETKLYIGQPLQNVYVRSKFEAEAAVLQAKLEGLDAIVIRAGNLVNRRSDLKFQKNHHENATLAKLKAFFDLGLYPRKLVLYPIEFSPVDDTAKAVIELARHYDGRCPVFHVYNHKPVRFGALVKAARAAGKKMKPVSAKDFIRAVHEAGGMQETAHIHEAFINDIVAGGNLGFQSRITLDSRVSAQLLRRIGFAWQGIDRIYLEKYVNYFKNIEYWSKD